MRPSGSVAQAKRKNEAQAGCGCDGRAKQAESGAAAPSRSAAATSAVGQPKLFLSIQAPRKDSDSLITVPPLCRRSPGVSWLLRQAQNAAGVAELLASYATEAPLSGVARQLRARLGPAADGLAAPAKRRVASAASGQPKPQIERRYAVLSLSTHLLGP